MKRRDLLKFGLLGTTAALSPKILADDNTQKNREALVTHKIQDKKRVIIIGGGYAGLSVAKSLRLNDSNVEIVVFEQKNIFASCPYSNLWLGGIANVSYQDLLFSPLEPAAIYRYTVINDKVIDIDKNTKTITTATAQYEYSTLVLATGIEYDYTTFGLNEQEAKDCHKLFPPSYSGGYEQLSLKKKIENFKEGTFVITVPKGAYRCPPAPYERACVVADYFKSKNIKAKVVILDPREKPTTKAKGFLQAFKNLGEYIEYIPTSTITKIDIAKKVISYDLFNAQEKRFVKKELAFHDANIIPSNKGSFLLQKSQLATTTDGWAKTKALTFETLNDENIFVAGDIVGEYPFPKSAQMAVSCGNIVGEHIAKKLQNKAIDYTKNLPANVCYSLVNATTGIYVTHQAFVENNTFKVKTELFEEATNATFVATRNWYQGITEYIFE